MRLALLSVLFAAPVLAQAPVAFPCGAGVACVGTAGQPVQLGGAIKASQGYWPDGGLALIENIVSGVPVTIQGNQSRTSTLPDVIVAGANSRDGGQPIFSVRTGSHTVFSVSGAGVVTSSGDTNTGTLKVAVLDAGVARVNGTLQTLGPNLLGQITTVQALDAGVYSKVGGVSIGGEVAQDAGVASHFCQHGYGAMTAGELAVTYTRAFSSNASCICSHTQTTNTNACGIKTGTAPSTTDVTFAVASGDTDVVFWLCCGDI